MEILTGPSLAQEMWELLRRDLIQAPTAIADALERDRVIAVLDGWFGAGGWFVGRTSTANGLPGYAVFGAERAVEFPIEETRAEARAAAALVIMNIEGPC